MDRQQWWRLALIAFIVGQVFVASRGLEVLLGMGAPAVVMISLILRFGLTFVIGAFLYAYLALDWPWQLSVLFSAPSVILLIPKMLPDLVSAGAWWRGRLQARSEAE